MATATIPQTGSASAQLLSADSAASTSTVALRDENADTNVRRIRATQLLDSDGGLALGGGTSQTASFTADIVTFFYPCNATSALVVASLPAASASVGCYVAFKKTDTSANLVTIDAAGSDLIDGLADWSLYNKGDVVILHCSTTSTWEVVGGYQHTVVLAKTAAFTGISQPVNAFYPCDATTAAFTATLPAALGFKGRTILVKKTDASANAVTVDGNASETIDGAATASLAARYDSALMLSDGSNWHLMALSV